MLHILITLVAGAMKATARISEQGPHYRPQILCSIAPVRRTTNIFGKWYWNRTRTNCFVTSAVFRANIVDRSLPLSAVTVRTHFPSM
jgi:hypothetical protein